MTWMRSNPLPLTLLAVLLAAGARAQPAPEPREPKDAAAVERMLAELSNWGRWGDDDQLGTVNLITPEVRKRAAGLVAKGITVSLAHATLTEDTPDNSNPYAHDVVLHGQSGGTWAVDRLSVLFHGYAHSHLDALCHMFHDGKMYNGSAGARPAPGRSSRGRASARTAGAVRSTGSSRGWRGA